MKCSKCHEEGVLRTHQRSVATYVIAFRVLCEGCWAKEALTLILQGVTPKGLQRTLRALT